LYRAFKENLPEIRAIKSEKTKAEGIAIAAPVRGKQILEAVGNTGGDFIAVTETEIIHALKDMGGKGFYIEPTSAAAIAGITKYLQQSGNSENELIVSAFTGHGLKASHGHSL
jgi:threonine synthase